MPKARQTCTECSMRRQKCDRQTPCSRCVRRGDGDKCTLVWPGNYDPKKHRIYPRPDTSPIEESTLEHADSNLSEYDFKTTDLLREPHLKYNGANFEWDGSGFGGTGAAQMSFLQLLMPNRKQVFDMVEYHIDSILWYHGSFHGPTFRRELNEIYQSPSGFQVRSCDLRWLALLYAVMANSLTNANHHTAQSWDFSSDERPKLTTQWFKASVTCLNLSNYMLRHHIYSVQTITTLTMCAHTLGFSAEQSVLLGGALKIAQSLGLQRLSTDDEDSLERIIKRETGRRVWSQLLIQDWFAIPSSDMYSINHLHYTTKRSMYCDDETMKPVAEDTPCMSTFLNQLLDYAILMPAAHDGLCNSNSLHAKYQHVLDYDAKLRAIDLPPILSMKEQLKADWPKWIPWARRSLTICAAHKTIMIHRSFLGRSFTDQAFAFTRQACIEAAKIILKEARHAYDEEGPLLWIDQAFMVAAGITLALDIFHRTKDEPELEDHRELAELTVTMLGKYENSMIADRGIRLISSLLAENVRLQSEKGEKRSADNPLSTTNKRAKFDVPRFVEQFAGNDSFTQRLKQQPASCLTASDAENLDDRLVDTVMEPFEPPDFSYEAFAELFPPQTGISNAFLFQDLLNFDQV